METDNSNARNGTRYEKIITAIQRLGLPTVIVAALFWFMGADVWPFFERQFEKTAEMQAAVTEAIKAQSAAAVSATETNTRIAQTLNMAVQQSVENRKLIIENNEAIVEAVRGASRTVELMQSAHEMMKETPSERREMIRLLKDISEKLSQ